MTILARIWLVGSNTLACLIHVYDITLVITIWSGDSRIKSTFKVEIPFQHDTEFKWETLSCASLDIAITVDIYSL